MTTDIIAVIAGLVAAWSGLLIWIIKWLIDRAAKHSDHVIKTMREDLKRLDGDFRNLLADLPEKYVLRDDWVRMVTRFDSKLDALSERIGNDLRDILTRLGNRNHD